ncbi:MAG: DegV family protein [Oscillospiraceae bacterium]|nr:DegV family protein [Oscillospiraceae bacterium]
MVRIITDSAADLEPLEYERLNVTCIPLRVSFGDGEYQENVNLSKEKFYELLLGSEEFPKTSQASPAILEELLAEAKAQGDEAIYITLSSALSGTYQTACMIAEDSEHEGAHIFDSRNATGGQRMLVEYACRLRDQGKNAAEIVAGLESIRDRVELYACVNTLEYLHKGGRISHAVYTLGSLAQIKPIISVDTEGRVALPAKVMGMRKGMDFLCKRLGARKPDGDHPVYVMYTNNRSVAETLAQRMAANGWEIPDGRIIQVGAAIGAHVGPDACGVVYIGE